MSERLRPQFETKGVELSVHCEVPLPVVVDEQRTLQILTNLIGNALTYTPAGGHVRVTGLRREGGVAAIEVADTGAGLALEDTERVFERFYRAAGLERPAGGSGIGLTIARRFSRLQAGDIVASSSGVGHGSVFVLTLPMVPAWRALLQLAPGPRIVTSTNARR